MTAARQALWRDAQVLSEAAGPALPPRLRRLAVRGDAPLALADIHPPPDWAQGDAARLARLTGAVLVSRLWSRAIAGEVLGRACEAVGEEALDALLALPDLMAPEVDDPAAARGDGAALDRLGASALAAATDESAARRDRLARRTGAAAGAPVAAFTGAAAMRTAQGVLIALAAPAAPAAPTDPAAPTEAGR